MDAEKLKVSTTTDGLPPEPGLEQAAAPGAIKANGQHKSYWVLTEEERSKGFVRNVRTAYRHVGPPGPTNPIRDLSAEELERFKAYSYAQYEAYPENDSGSSVVGRYWTQAELDRANGSCGAVTTMGRSIAETYARDPLYYGSTFCCACGKHFPVGAKGEFVWDVAPTERVGT